MDVSNGPVPGQENALGAIETLTSPRLDANLERMRHPATWAASLALALSSTSVAQVGGVDEEAPEPIQPQIRLTGRVIADATLQPDEIIEVRLEGSGGDRIGFAYTESSGAFQFRPVVLEPGRFYYVVVEYEGHRPFRERLDHMTDIRSGAPLIVFLEGVESPAPAPGPSDDVVDVRQLEAAIPAEARAEYDRAMEEIGQGLYLSAIPRLERAVELAPDFYEALNSLGGQYVRVHRYRDAQAALEKALELSPASTPPLVNLGFLHYQEGQALTEDGDADGARARFDRAVDALDRAVRNDPTDATARHYLGAALYARGDADRAEAMLDLALELDPADDEVRLVLINLYARQERFDEVLAEAGRYLERRPDSPMRPPLERLVEQIRGRIDRRDRRDD